MACLIKEYRTINGQEKHDQINNEDFKVDLKQFIDPKSNKIKFKLSAVKKLLPYNGFYPQQRTMQIAGIFNKVYLDNTGICTDQQKNSPCSSSGGDLSSGSQGLFATLAATQPLFSPGILFNTIKAGIAVDWPTFITASDDMDVHSIYDVKLYEEEEFEVRYSLKSINTRLPFETILDPSFYYKSYVSDNSGSINSGSIPYLDPTHISYLNFFRLSVTNIPHITYQQINLMNDATYNNIYQSAINNFLYETVNFFLIDKTLCYFGSREFNKDEKINRDNNKDYTMDIVIKKNPNFSMFNQMGYSGSGQYIHSASLFGPPCSSSHDLLTPYLPYAPPYFRENGESRIRISLPSGSQYPSDLSILDTIEYLQINNKPNETTLQEDVANYNKMTLENCLHLRLPEIKDNKIRWYIQTKFETPLINFSKCSSVEVSQSNNVLKDYPPPT